MDDSFFRYLQLLEIFAFFTGYPIIYAFVAFLKGNAKSKTTFRNTIFILLPFAYATVGLLYMGLQLKKLYPDFTLAHITAEIHNPFLTIWGLLSLLFWIPVLSKKPIISLFHSLVFFFLLVKNFYLQLISATPDNDFIKNYMRVYSDSIIVNIGVLFSLLIISYIIRFIKKKNSVSDKSNI